MNVLSDLRHELESKVHARTSRRIQNFEIDVFPERVILRGNTSTFYIKQLAQQGVRDVLPDVRVENAITVD